MNDLHLVIPILGEGKGMGMAGGWALRPKPLHGLPSAPSSRARCTSVMAMNLTTVAVSVHYHRTSPPLSRSCHGLHGSTLAMGARMTRAAHMHACGMIG